jgi:hypothetical protein
LNLGIVSGREFPLRRCGGDDGGMNHLPLEGITVVALGFVELDLTFWSGGASTR